jgi:hypothetical protein
LRKKENDKQVQIMMLKIKEHIENFCTVFGDDASKMTYILPKIQGAEKKNGVDLMALSL